jgi:hypothetical protein
MGLHMTTKVNWNQDQPIVKYLRRWVPAIFPVIHQNHPLGRGVGGYVSRTTAMGMPSAHAEGRAADIYLNANDGTQRRIGDGLFEIFRTWRRELGIDHVIWNGQIWSVARGGPRRYTRGDPHIDHVHVAFTRAGSQLQPSILIPLLDGLCLDVYGTMDGQERAPRG